MIENKEQSEKEIKQDNKSVDPFEVTKRKVVKR